MPCKLTSASHVLQMGEHPSIPDTTTRIGYSISVCVFGENPPTRSRRGSCARPLHSETRWRWRAAWTPQRGQLRISKDTSHPPMSSKVHQGNLIRHHQWTDQHYPAWESAGPAAGTPSIDPESKSFLLLVIPRGMTGTVLHETRKPKRDDTTTQRPDPVHCRPYAKRATTPQLDPVEILHPRLAAILALHPLIGPPLYPRMDRKSKL